MHGDYRTCGLLVTFWLGALCAAHGYPSERVLPPKDNSAYKLLADPPGNYPSKVHPRGYVAYRATSPITVDGLPTDSAWEGTAWSEPFQDISGDATLQPWYDTRIKLLWDDHYLYVAAKLQDPKPWATLTHHDSIIFKDNDFEIFLNPSGSHHQYMEWEFNAYGSVWDLLLLKPYRDGGPPLMSWETIAPSEATQATGVTGWQPIKRAVHVDGVLNNGSVSSEGWSIEVALPWTVICQVAGTTCPPTNGVQYRINFSRVQWNVTWRDRSYHKDPPEQAESNWVWSPQYIVNMHYPELWGYLQFSDIQSGAGSTAFVEDPNWAVKTFMMDVYYTQQAYRSQHGRYSASLDDLGIKAPHVAREGRFQLDVTRVGFLASVQLDQALLCINEESRMWSLPLSVSQLQQQDMLSLHQS